MEPSQIPKGKSSETNFNGAPLHQPGIYQHKDTKGIFITAEGEAGVIQADALMSPVWKDAWERTGDVPNRLELLKLRKQQQVDDAKEEAAQKQADEAELAAALAPEKLPAGGATYTPETK